ncbi:MAG: DUF805 domain-containing protein [Albidovulum sp.]|uniref:DUF805 domain-containing protein n=1 Tax=Albidovulum sp. TaxID=1872424 RepID=UPI003C9EDCDA
MQMMTAVRTCFSKYATFRGRARRAEYWWFVAFNILVSVGLSILDGMAFGIHHWMMTGSPGSPLSSLYSLAVFLPSLAAGVRRLHDTGKSGWWVLIWLIPLIGWVILIWFLATPGDEGRNDYGPDPLAGDGYGASSFPRVPRQ